jgi:hypothetical protein
MVLVGLRRMAFSSSDRLLFSCFLFPRFVSTWYRLIRMIRMIRLIQLDTADCAFLPAKRGKGRFPSIPKWLSIGKSEVNVSCFAAPHLTLEDEK